MEHKTLEQAAVIILSRRLAKKISLTVANKVHSMRETASSLQM